MEEGRRGDESVKRKERIEEGIEGNGSVKRRIECRERKEGKGGKKNKDPKGGWKSEEGEEEDGEKMKKERRG